MTMTREQSAEEKFIREWVPFFDFPFDAERVKDSADDRNFVAQVTHAINALPGLIATIDALEARPVQADATAIDSEPGAMDDPPAPGSCGNCGAATADECAKNDCPESYTATTPCGSCAHPYDKHDGDDGDSSVGMSGFEWCNALGDPEEIDGACKCDHFTAIPSGRFSDLDAAIHELEFETPLDHPVYRQAAIEDVRAAFERLRRTFPEVLD